MHHAHHRKHCWRIGSRYAMFCLYRSPDARYIYVNVGLGFHPQLTLEEAIAVTHAKEKLLTAYVAPTPRSLARSSLRCSRRWLVCVIGERSRVVDLEMRIAQIQARIKVVREHRVRRRCRPSLTNQPSAMHRCRRAFGSCYNSPANTCYIQRTKRDDLVHICARTTRHSICSHGESVCECSRCSSRSRWLFGLWARASVPSLLRSSISLA